MSLDAREYTLKVDEALEERLDRTERKLAIKDLRRVIENLAFEFGIRKGRVQPWDIDYALALEALKPPEQVAAVLARARPRYRRRKRQKRLRMVAVLLVLGLVVYSVAALSTSQVSDPVFEWSDGVDEPVSQSVVQSFNVTSDDYTRLDYEMWVFLRTDEGSVTITLLDPSNQPVLQQTFTRGSGNYDRGNVQDPEPGTWRVVVDYEDAEASVRLDVNGVRPAP